uniref:ST14 transmembrane serine protease matriptase b n=1 Tax=Electrophorus electricus TaxID=8005 RepID=A0A4W4EDV1_ELEEL
MSFANVTLDTLIGKKTLPCRSIFLTVLVIFGAVTTLTVILQVWLHLCNIMRVFCGSMAISNQRFSRSYEDAKSIQFKELASKVVKQIKNIYGNVPLLSRYYIGSSVQAFSEFHDGSVIVYYMSEFHVPLIYVSTVDEVINSNDLTGMFRHTRKFLGPESDKALHIYNLVSGAMDLRLVNATLRGHYRHTHRCHRGKTGTIQSIGFSYIFYPRNIYTEWQLRADPGYRIRLKFIILNMEKDCHNNFIKVYDSLVPTEKQVLTEMCGELPANKVHFSKTNRISVIFYSDMSYVDKGFSAEFEAVEPSEKCSGKFQCENDECIHSVLRCDGIDDCGDLSDEKNCVCKESDIKCKNGFCKPKYWRCDGVNDCGDNTDEENCGICRAGEITCRNNRCVSEHRKCDGHDDCGDGTDESECPKPIVVSCSEYTYKCRDNKCISKHNPQCDGDKDCEDGSDEIDCDCGSKPYKRSRIVGGQTSTEGEWPWQASLHVKGHGHACGASLISNRWMITAAHCVHDSGQIIRYSQPDVWMVHLGLHTQGHYNRWTIHKNVKQIISHPDYDPTEFDNDIALIELDSPIKLSQRVWPICMPAATDQFLAGQSVWITGWGRISENGMLAKVLQKAQVRVINDTVCSQLMGNKVTPRMICAGVLNGGVDACQGDSGGPLSYIDMASGRWFLAGVVSWGDGCGRKSKPGIYSRVTKFRRWIRAKTGV